MVRVNNLLPIQCIPMTSQYPLKKSVYAMIDICQIPQSIMSTERRDNVLNCLSKLRGKYWVRTKVRGYDMFSMRPELCCLLKIACNENKIVNIHKTKDGLKSATRALIPAELVTKFVQENYYPEIICHSKLYQLPTYNETTRSMKIGQHIIVSMNQR